MTTQKVTTQLPDTTATVDILNKLNVYIISRIFNLIELQMKVSKLRLLFTFRKKKFFFLKKK